MKNLAYSAKSMLGGD